MAAPHRQRCTLLTRMNFTDLADGYLRYYRSQWVWEFEGYNEVILLCDDPDTAVEMCAALAEKCHSTEELAYIAAGPFEDVLKQHGVEVIDSFKVAAAKSEKVRVALSGVWIRKTDPVFEAWKQMMIDFGYWNHNPMSPLDRGWEPGMPCK